MVGVLGPWSRLRHRFVSAIPHVLELSWHSGRRRGMTKKRRLAFLFHFNHKFLNRHWVIQIGLYHEFCTSVSSETKPISGLSKAVLSLQVILAIGITKGLLFANNHLVNLFHPSPFIFLLLDTMPFYTTYSPYNLWYPSKTSTYGHFLLASEKGWSASWWQKIR